MYGRLYKDKRCERDLIEVQCHLMICTTTSSSLRLIGWLKLTVIFAFWNKCLTLFIIISRKITQIEGHRNCISSTNSFFIEAMRKDLLISWKSHKILWSVHWQWLIFLHCNYAHSENIFAYMLNLITISHRSEETILLLDMVSRDWKSRIFTTCFEKFKLLDFIFRNTKRINLLDTRQMASLDFYKTR